MPEGISVLVADGVATIDFLDSSKRGPGLARLFAAGAAGDQVRKRTRMGPRPVYQVPEVFARAAGLIDGDWSDDAPAPTGKSYDDGEPDLDWSRADLDAAALKAGVVDVDKLPNKAAVLKAYRAAKNKS